MASSRADSVDSTSTASASSGGTPRFSRSTAKRIGVSGFFSSCATCRADSRNAARRSASIAARRPASTSVAICRMPSRSRPNSGAPRAPATAGSGSPRLMRSVHPTSSCRGRLSCLLRWPAARDASRVSSARPTRPVIRRTGTNRCVRNSNRCAYDTDVATCRSCSANARSSSADRGARRATSSALAPLAATLSHAAVPLSFGSSHAVVPLHASVSTIEGTNANSARMRNSRER